MHETPKTTNVDLKSTIYYYVYVICSSVYKFCSMYMDYTAAYGYILKCNLLPATRQVSVCSPLLMHEWSLFIMHKEILIPITHFK